MKIKFILIEANNFYLFITLFNISFSKWEGSLFTFEHNHGDGVTKLEILFCQLIG